MYTPKWSLLFVGVLVAVSGLTAGVSQADTISHSWFYPDSTPLGASTANLTDPTGSFSQPTVAMGGNSAIAVWANETGGIGVIETARSSDGGVTWVSPTTTPTGATPALSASGQVASAPQVAMSGSNAIAVWKRSDGSNTIIQTAISADAGATWSDPTTMPGGLTSPNLSNSGQNATEPQIAIDGNNAVVVWNRTDGTSPVIQTAHSSDAGQTWSNPTAVPGALSSPNLSATGAGFIAYKPVVAISGLNVVAAWYGNTVGTDLAWVAHSSDAGVTWSYPTATPAGSTVPTLSSNTGSSSAKIDVGVSGSRMVAVWRESNGSAHSLKAALSTDAGVTWSSPASTPLGANTPNLSDPALEVSDIDLAMDGSTAIVVWSGTSGSTSTAQILRSLDAGGSWTTPSSTPRGANTSNLSSATQPAAYARVSIVGTAVTAVWMQEDGTGSGFALKFAPQVVSSLDAGATWTYPNETPTGIQGFLASAESYGFYLIVPSVAVGTSRAAVVWAQRMPSGSAIQSAYSSTSVTVDASAPAIPMQAFPTPTKFTAQECADYAAVNSAALELDWGSLAGREGEGWWSSYAEFPNDHTGGWVCIRQPAYGTTGSIIFR